MKYELVNEWGMHRMWCVGLPEALAMCREHGLRINWR